MAHFTSNPDGYCDSFGELDQLWSDLDQLEQALTELSEISLSFIEEDVDRTIDSIRAFEPSFCIIGQSNAGKDALINVLAGQPGLLSSDDSRWCAISPSLHLNARFRPSNTRALFRFFDRKDCEQRGPSSEGCGAEFDEMIGGSHAFPNLDPTTLQRYIYSSPPEDLPGSEAKGNYAEITKFADLYIDLPYLPKGLCLRDTPNVNNRFTRAEQITLKAISESTVYVLVVSAHQALTGMDAALLRILCSVDPRDVVIFVNQIDELADPAGDSRKIKASITKSLQQLGGDDGYEILFGSGYWADCALRNICEMSPASRDALAVLYGTGTEDMEALRHRAFAASGIQNLLKAVAKRVVDGPGQAFMNDVRKRVETIIERSETVANVALKGAGRSIKISERQLRCNLLSATQSALNSFDQNSAMLRTQLRQRLEQDQETFVSSALIALQAHIKTDGGFGTWSHDPAPLLQMMKTSFTTSCAKLRREGENAFDLVLDGALGVLEHDLGITLQGSSIAFPKLRLHTAPTPLARRLPLDLQGQWWRKYWRFGGTRAAERRYREVILEETTPLIDDLIADVFDRAVVKTREVIKTLGDSQAAYCKAILARSKDPATGEGQPEGKPSDTHSFMRLSA